MEGARPADPAHGGARRGGVPAEEVAEIDARVGAEIDRIAAEALAAPAPDPSTAWTDMWSDGSSSWRN